METIQTVVIGIVEGITEFLPISSTAHMVIAQKLLHVPESETGYLKTFTVAIQLGAILSVVFLYWKKFFDFTNWKFYVKLALAVVPALIFGKLFSEQIDEILEKPIVIAGIMILGGVVFLFVDKMFNNPEIEDEKQVSFVKSIGIGLFQCLAIVFPGLSRSAATIIGGMSLKLSRSAAAEFSFFLAVPTMMAATGYKLYTFYHDNGGFSKDQIQQLAIGNIVAFIVAILAIRFFIGFLKKHGFKIWGYYRIALGIILLILIYAGVIS